MNCLNPPKKTPAGYYLAAVHPIIAPSLCWSSNSWDISGTWLTWASTTRESLLGELLSHGSWFSKPPRRDILEPLFGPFAGHNMQGRQQIFCKTPDIPGPKGSSGEAVWALDGILMTSTSISPVWSLHSYTVHDEQDTISLFGDAVTVDEEAEAELAAAGVDATEGTREIQLEELGDALPALGPTHIRSREWEARKFMNKERVREARLKAQIAERLAHREESRFFRKYGEYDDGESHFSDYDLSDISDSSDSDTDTDAI
jgi:hypothetical protein